MKTESGCRDGEVRQSEDGSVRHWHICRAKEGGIDPKEFGLITEELVHMEDIIRDAMKAGLTAATITMVIKVAPEIYKAIQHLIEEGEIDEEEYRNIGYAAVTGASEGFVRGSISQI